MDLAFILPSPSQDEARRSVLRITAAAIARPAERPRNWYGSLGWLRTSDQAAIILRSVFD
jgi:hypothetical protein